MRVLLIFSLLVTGALANAQDWVVNPNLTYFSRKLEQTAGTNQIAGKVDVLTVDVKGGYLFDFGLFAGLQTVFEKGTNTGTDMKNYFAGPSVGYLSDDTGIFITAAYHVVGKSDLGVFGEYSKAQGLQIDLGYPMMITEEIKFGPQVSYKSIKYSDGPTGAPDTTTKQLTPYFGLWLFF